MNRRAAIALRLLALAAVCLTAPLFRAGAAEPPVGDLVVDRAGRRIQMSRPFVRIVSLYPAHTENLFSLGLDREIIGVSASETHPAAALEKPVFSYHDDPEKFLAARPDLVLIRPMIDQGYAALVRRLEKSGITVVSLQPATPDQMYRYWEALGRLTGRRKQAAEMVDHFKRRLQEITAVTGSISPKQRVYFEAVGRRMKTFSPDSISMFVLRAAGGVNVADDADPVRGTNIAAYGKERILSHADEIDAYIAQRGAMNRPTVASIVDEPGFSAIEAVRKGRILIVDEAVVSRPTVRLLEGVRTIALFLYPHLPGNPFGGRTP